MNLIIWLSCSSFLVVAIVITHRFVPGFFRDRNEALGFAILSAMFGPLVLAFYCLGAVMLGLEWALVGALGSEKP